MKTAKMKGAALDKAVVLACVKVGMVDNVVRYPREPLSAGSDSSPRFVFVNQMMEGCGLDKAVGMFDMATGKTFCPQTNWEQAGLIIDHQKITLAWQPSKSEWMAGQSVGRDNEFVWLGYDASPLVSVMRCFVMVTFGSDINKADLEQ